MATQTTHGHAAYRDGQITIRFGLLEGSRSHTVEVDVTPYVTALARDLLIAETAREAAREEA